MLKKSIYEKNTYFKNQIRMEHENDILAISVMMMYIYNRGGKSVYEQIIYGNRKFGIEFLPQTQIF